MYFVFLYLNIREFSNSVIAITDLSIMASSSQSISAAGVVLPDAQHFGQGNGMRIVVLRGIGMSVATQTCAASLIIPCAGFVERCSMMPDWHFDVAPPSYHDDEEDALAAEAPASMADPVHHHIQCTSPWWL